MKIQSAPRTTALAAWPANARITAIAAASAIAILSMGGKSAAAHSSAPALYSLGSLAQISVIDRASGQALPLYRFGGEYWVAGTPGAKYSVTVTNRARERILAVTSVDGVNVVSGETASVDQTGYIINRFQSYAVSGWRKSDTEVAAFTFVASPKSYASRTGRPDNVGTIGIAVFPERAPIRWNPAPRINEPELNQPYRYESPRQKSSETRENYSERSAPAESAPLASPAPSATDGVGSSSARSESAKRSAQLSDRAAAAPQRVEESLGTGHGRREYDSITRSHFERASAAPSEVIRIRYDSYSNLVSMGVIREAHRDERTPNPFPESYGHNGYAPDPPRWFR